MEDIPDSQELQKILDNFSCSRDEDIEFFLHTKAVEFEKLSKARTYLVCDEEQLTSSVSSDPLKIYGYLSLALKILTVPSTVSNRIRKDLDGFSAKIHGEVISDFPCYLIGQLSRDSSIPADVLPGSRLIEMACDVIAQAVKAVGGRTIMIECHDDPHLIDFYQRNQFSEIARIPDGNHAMVQMIRKI